MTSCGGEDCILKEYYFVVLAYLKMDSLANFCGAHSVDTQDIQDEIIVGGE